MSSPFNAGRDSNNPAGNAFGAEPDVADSDVGAFQDAFRPPADRLAEEDYRGPEHGGFSGGGTDNVTPTHEAGQFPQRFTYPTPQQGGRL